jgi:hypothetical protein
MLDNAPIKRLVVHIGMHKTGTTSIQYMLHENMRALLDQGVFYPMAGRHHLAHVQHAMLAAGLLNSKLEGDFALTAVPDVELVLNSIRQEAEIADVPTIILSAEDMWAAPADRVAMLAKIFPDYDIEPVMYIRALPDWMEALHQTKLLYGMYTPAQLGDPNFKFWEQWSPDELDYRKIAQTWSSVAKDGKVWVQNYDAEGHIDSRESFAAIAGFNTLSLTDQGRSNASVSPSISRLIGYMSAYGVPRDQNDGLLSQLRMTDPDEPQTLLPPEVRQNLYDTHDQRWDDLMTSGFVKTHPQIGQVSRPRIDRVYIGDVRSAIFALGRAIQRKEAQRSASP